MYGGNGGEAGGLQPAGGRSLVRFSGDFQKLDRGGGIAKLDFNDRLGFLIKNSSLFHCLGPCVKHARWTPWASQES